MTLRNKVKGTSEKVTKEIVYNIIQQIKHLKGLTKEIDERISMALYDNRTLTKTELVRLLTKDIFNFRSLRRKEFWEERGWSKDESETKVSEIQRKCSPRCVEYYLEKGINEDIARNEISKLQSTATLQHHITSNGHIAGYISYNPKKYKSTSNDTSIYDSGSLGFFLKDYPKDIAEQKYKENNKKKGSCGIQNPMYGKPAPKGAGYGISGHFKGHYFRSLLELRFINSLIEENIPFKDNDVNIRVLPDKVMVKYSINDIQRTYTPDYLIGDRVIEVKPKGMIKFNNEKFKAAEEWCKKNNRVFEIVTEEQIPLMDLNHPDILIDSGKLERFKNQKGVK